MAVTCDPDASDVDLMAPVNVARAFAVNGERGVWGFAGTMTDEVWCPADDDRKVKR